MRRIIVLCVAVAVAGSGIAHGTEPEVSGEVWYRNGLCLNGFAQTRHGAPTYSNPQNGTGSAAQPNGEFHNEAVSVRDHDVFYVGGTIRCWAAREKMAGQLSAKAVILKWRENASPAVCMVVTWRENVVPAFAFAVNAQTAPGEPGMCGAGNYKMHAFQRIWENDRWQPAAQSCDANTKSNCIKGMVTPEWHWFPVDVCHLEPDACDPPD